MFPRSITKNTPKPHKTALLSVPTAIPAPPPPPPARKKSRLTANGALLAAFALLALTLIPAHHASAQGTAVTFSGVITGAVTEDAATDTATGTLTATLEDGSATTVSTQTAAPGMYGAFTIDAAGAWTYTLDNALDAVQGLSAGSTADDVFTVTASVNSAATQDITITITGVNDAPTVTLVASSPTGIGNSDLFGDELNPGGVLTLTATAVDPDVNDALTFAWTEVPRFLDASLGSFSDATAAVTTWTAPASIANLYTTGLTVTVGDGATSTSQTFLISLADNVLAFTAPIPDQFYPQDDAISDLTLPAATGEGLRGIGTPTTYALDPVPAGLTFDDATRILSGTPTDAATSATTHTYTATDGESRISITFTINDFMPEFAATIADQRYPTGESIALTLPEPTSGNTPLSYTLTPALPGDLTFDDTTRVLSGTPTTEQAAVEYTYTVTDNEGDTAQLTFTLEVTAVPPLIFDATIRRQRYAPDEPISVTLPAATGGIGGLTYAINPTPALPTGLTFTPATRVLGGTPTTEQDAVEYTYTVTDSDTPPNSVELPFTIAIGQFGNERVVEKTLAAFGRAFATGTVGVFEDYLTTPGGRANTSHFTLGGHKFELATTTPAQTLDSRVASVRKPLTRQRALTLENDDSVVNTLSVSYPQKYKSPSVSFPNDRKTGSDSDHAFHRIGNPVEHHSANTTTMSAKDLLTKSAFHLNLNNDPSSTSGWSLWARATTTNFDGKPEDDFELDGDVTSAYLGADYQTPTGTRLGIAISETSGEVDYDDATDEAQGDLDADLTSILPYIQWQPNDTTNAWAMLGYGKGDAELSTDGDDETTEVDIDMQMIALGVSGDLTTYKRSEWSWKASAFAVELESEADEEIDLPEVTADSQRLRAAIQGRVPGQVSATGAQFTPNWELGLRWDDGDAEQGSGADLGLGFDYTNPANGLSVQGKTTFLVAHEAEDYEEWDASLQARLDPGVQGRGVTFTLEPGWTEDGRSQRMGMDFSNALGKWSKRGLRLELTGERTEKTDNNIGHNIRLTGSLRF